MGYRVEYVPERKSQKGRGHPLRLLVLTGLCLAAFLLLVNLFWPQGAQTLRSLLLPEKAAVTAAALEELAQELQAGQSSSGALEDFCWRVFQEAGFAAG